MLKHSELTDRVHHLSHVGGRHESLGTQQVGKEPGDHKEQPHEEVRSSRH